MNDIDFSTIEQLLRSLKESEAHKNSAISRLRETEPLLARSFAASELDATQTILYAEALRTLDRPSRSAFVLEELLLRDPPERSLVAWHLAASHRQVGNFAEARRVLNGVDEKFKRLIRFRKELAMIDAAQRTSESVDTAQRAFAALQSSRHKAAEMLLKGGAALGNWSDGELEELDSLIDESILFMKGAPLPPPVAPPLSSKAKILFVAGFGWSGSGAVADYLRDSPDVFFPFGNAEVTCFEGVGKLKCGAVHLQRKLKSGTAADIRQTAVQMILCSVFALALPQTTAKEGARLFQKSLLVRFAKRDINLCRLTTAARRFLRALSAALNETVSVESAQAALSDLLVTIINDLGNGSRFLLINNCVHAHNVSFIPSIPNAVAVCVIRDARDQFTARVIENLRARVSLDTYIDRTKVNRQRYEAAINDPEIASKTIQLRFEDFVTDEAVRTGLRANLGIRDFPMAKLDPVASSQNIGISKRYPDQAEISRIRTELSAYCYDH